MEMIGTLEFYLTLLIIVIFYRDITAEAKVCTDSDFAAVCDAGQICVGAAAPKKCGCNKAAGGDEPGDGTDIGTCTVDGQLCTAKGECLACVDNKMAGNGKTKGNCAMEDQVCTALGECLECTVNGVKGDDTKKGSCAEGLLCKADGTCVCEPNHCNNGTCAVEDKKPKCTCATGFTGMTCETSVCPDDYCKNNGTCAPDTDDPTKPDCDCAKSGEFAGDTCEEIKTVDGMWADFGEWGECKETELKQTRTRNCTMPAPAGDPTMGKACEGDESEKKDCTIDVPATNVTNDTNGEGMTKAPADGENPQNGTGTTGGAPIPMIQGIATKVLLFNLAAGLQNWVKNNLQF